MAALHWVLNLLLLMASLELIISIKFFRDEDIVGRPAIVHDFFAMDEMFTGSKRNNIYAGPPNVGANWCSYEKAGEGIYTAKKMGSCNAASVDKLLQLYFPGETLKTVTKYFDGELFGVIKITAERSSKMVTFETEPRSDFRVMSGYILVKNSTKVVFKWKSDSPMSLTNIEIKLDGESSIGGFTAATKISKPMRETQFEIEKLYFGNSQIIFFDLVRPFQVSHSGLARAEDNLNTAKYETESWTAINGSGVFDTTDEFQLSLQTTAEPDKHFIISRFKDKTGTAVAPTVSLVMIFPSSKTIQSIIDPLLNVKNYLALRILDFKFSSWCMFASGTAVKFLSTNSKLYNKVSKCIPKGDKKEIPVGWNLKVPIRMNDAYKNCGATAEELAALPINEILNLAMTKTAPKFSLPASYKTPIKASIKCLQVDGLSYNFNVPSFEMFNDNKAEPVFQLKEFSYTPENAEVKGFYKVIFILTLPEKYRTIPDTKIGFTSIKLQMQSVEDKGWDFTGSTNVTFNDSITTIVELNRKVTDETPVWKFTLKVPSFTYTDLKALFTNTKAGDATAVPAIQSWGIKDFVLEWTVETQTTAVRVKGNPILFGYNGAYLEGIFWKPKNTGKIYVNGTSGEKVEKDQPANAYALAVWFKNINLDWLLKKLLGEDKLPVAFFSNINGIFSISNAHGIVKEGYTKEPANPPSTTTKDIIEDSQTDKIKLSQSTGGLRQRRKRALPRYVRHNPYLSQPRTDTPKQEEPTKKNVTTETIEFTIPGLKTTAIRPGVSMMFEYKLPSLTTECLDDDICKWMVENLGPEFLIKLEGYFEGKGKLEITATVGGVAKYIVQDVLKFHELVLKIRIGLSDPGIRIELAVLYTNKDISSSTLTFFGALQLGFTGSLKLEVGMAGIIEHPFNFEYLSLGNLFLSAEITVGPSPFPAIEAGAKVVLGKETNCEGKSKSICIEGFFGFNPNSPSDFWIYAKFNKLTIQSIMDAFDIKATIPEPLKDFGFPEGFQVSYAAKAKSIPKFGISAPQGFFLSGKVKLFDLELWGKIVVKTEGFEIDVNMKPLFFLNGFIKVSRSASDTVNGPICYIKVDKSIKVHIEGFIEVFGMRVYGKIVINETHYIFNISGPLIPFLIDARLILEASFGPIDKMSFYMSAEVMTSSFVEKVRQAIIDFCNEFGKKAEVAFDIADKVLQAVKSKLENAKSSVKAWQDRIKAWKDTLDQRLREIEKKKLSLKTDCKAECGTVCVPFFGWNPKCWRCFWSWCGCPTWDKCATTIPNILCLAKCEVNKLAQKFTLWVEKIGIKIQLALGDVALFLGDLATGVLSAAKLLVSFAAGVVEVVRKVTAGMLAMVKFVAKYSNLIFDLRKLKFFASMDHEFNACVGYEIDCTIFGITINSGGSACLSLAFLKSLVGTLTADEAVEKDYPGTKDIKKNLEEADGEIASVKDEETKFELESKDAAAKISTETAQKFDEESKRSDILHPDHSEILKMFPRRSTVPTEEQMVYLKAADEPIPEFDIRNEYITKAFNNGPWKMFEDFKPVGLDFKPVRDETETGRKRSLDFDKPMSSCERVKRALNGYQDVAEGLHISMNGLNAATNGINGYKKSLIEQKTDLHNQIKYIEGRHNLTAADKEDVYFWFHEFNDGINDYTKRSTVAMERQDQFSIPIIRRQLNQAAYEHNGKTFNDIADMLHKNAITGYKRSIIPTPQEINGEVTLSAIKKDLVSLISNDDNPLSDVKMKLKSVRANIRSMIGYTKQCRNQ